MTSNDLDAQVQKSTLIEDMERAHDQFQEALWRVPPQAYEQSGAAGKWSLKDILLHMSSWWDLALEALALLAEGQPASHLFDIDDIDDWNSERARAYRSRSAEEALREFHVRTDDLAGRIIDLPLEYVLLDPSAFQMVRRAVVDHYYEHLDDVQRAAGLA